MNTCNTSWSTVRSSFVPRAYRYVFQFFHLLSCFKANQACPTKKLSVATSNNCNHYRYLRPPLPVLKHENNGTAKLFFQANPSATHVLGHTFWAGVFPAEQTHSKLFPGTNNIENTMPCVWGSDGQKQPQLCVCVCEFTPHRLLRH
jgi:hypothetical protein